MADVGYRMDGRVQVVALIASLAACGGVACADDLRLATGEVLTGVQVLETTETTIRFVHPVLGELALPRDRVEILPPPPPPSPEDAAPEAAPVEAAAPDAAQKAEPTEPAEPAEPPAPPEWKFKLVVGAGLATGNTENGNFNSIFTATREVPGTRTVFDASYFFAQSDGDRSENRFSTGIRNDWLPVDSKWFYFVDGRFDADEFQSWDSRLTSHVGIGRKLIEPPDLRLNGLAGIGAVKEFGSDNDDLRPEALLGIEGEWQIAEKQTLKFDSTVFPDLSSLGEFRWVNNAAWSAVIDTENNLSVTAGVQHEYQSEVDPGRKHNDFRVFAGLQLDF